MPMRMEFHILQSFAPSNLNRDDTGSPKDALFGGVRRGRISSQCLKRAVRLYMRDEGLIPQGAEAHRTKRVTALLAEKLTARGAPNERALAAATACLTSVGRKTKQKDNRIKVADGKTQYLMFLGERELDSLAELIAPHAEALAEPSAEVPEDLTRQITEVLTRRAPDAIDIALYGRMLANLPEANQDAACQVAHAISTHSVDRDFDYFTAVDDRQPDDTTGADMIGTVEFNSSCYYRYSVIDFEGLVDNLAGDRALACRAVSGYARAVVEAEPTGKQNTFAAHNPPSTVLVTLRRSHGPRNLANAFEEPVRTNGEGLVRESANRLVATWRQIDDAYGSADAAWVLDLTGAFEGASAHRVDSLNDLVAAVEEAVA